MKAKTKVVMVRKWHEPKTKIKVTDEELSLEISLEDFIKAVKAEIGSVTWTFKSETFSKQIDEAVSRVIEGLS